MAGLAKTTDATIFDSQEHLLLRPAVGEERGNSPSRQNRQDSPPTPLLPGKNQRVHIPVTRRQPALPSSFQPEYSSAQTVDTMNAPHEKSSSSTRCRQLAMPFNNDVSVDAGKLYTSRAPLHLRYPAGITALKPEPMARIWEVGCLFHLG